MEAGPPADAPAAVREAPGAARTTAWRTGWRRWRGGVRDWIGAFVVTAGKGWTPWRPEFEAAHRTTTPPSWRRRWPTGWQRRSPSGCISGCAGKFWGYAPNEAWRGDDLIAEKYRGIRPAPGYPACPDTPRSRTLFRLAGSGDQRRGATHGELRHDAGVVGEWLGTSPTPRPQYFGSAGWTGTRWRTTPGGRGGHWRRRSAGWPPTWGMSRRRWPRQPEETRNRRPRPREVPAGVPERRGENQRPPPLAHRLPRGQRPCLRGGNDTP